MLRWAVDISSWDVTQEQLAVLYSLLPEYESAGCRRYRLVADQKRAVVSRFMQRACISRVLDLPWHMVEVRRTKGSKPFCRNTPLPATAPNFNFNVSHEGSFVVLASEPVCLCGVDVAAPQQLRTGPAAATLQQSLGRVRDAFSAEEWQTLQACGSDDQLLQDTFQKFWSVKEAYIKARGDGLGFAPLSRVHAKLPLPDMGPAGAGSIHAQLVVDCQLQDRWSLQLTRLPQHHWVCVALGPPDAAVDAVGACQTGRPVYLSDSTPHIGCTSSALCYALQEFTGTFLEPHPSHTHLQDQLHLVRPGFDLLTVEDLLPAQHLDAYLEAA